MSEKPVDDLALARAAREHAKQQAHLHDILKSAMLCPPSQTLTDFFAYHKIPYHSILSQAVLPAELKSLLAARMERLWNLIEAENKEWCGRYGVDNITMLSDSQFCAYQRKMSALMKREDYYTNIPSCKTVTDFFHRHKIPYHCVGSLGRLPPILRMKLNEAVMRFQGAFDAARMGLLARYHAASEFDLSSEEYRLYTAELCAVIKREDHYP